MKRLVLFIIACIGLGLVTFCSKTSEFFNSINGIIVYKKHSDNTYVNMVGLDKKEMAVHQNIKSTYLNNVKEEDTHFFGAKRDLPIKPLAPNPLCYYIKSCKPES